MAIIRSLHHRRNARLLHRPGWVLPDMSVDLDFVRGRFYVLGASAPFPEQLTIARSSTADLSDNDAGIYQTFGANRPRWTNKGLLVEKAATNVVIQNRDLSNAAWVKVNTTAAKDQVGVDGVSNSASSVTATAGNGTILQTDVLGSSSRLVSVFAKRITGTGTINLTGDGSTFTAITLTSNWTRFALAAATVVNPITGFQIVTSGDVIAVDFVQNETGPAMTSPITTAAAAVTRASETVTMALPTWFTNQSLALYGEAVFPTLNSSAIVAFDDGTANNRIYLKDNAGAGSGIIVDGASTVFNSGAATYAAGAIAKMALAIELNSARFACNGALASADTSCTIPTACTTLRFGAAGGATANLVSTYIRRIAFSPIRLAALRLQDITS